MKPTVLIASCLLAVFIPACVSTAPEREPPGPASLERVLGWMSGAWSNTGQYAAAPDALKRAPAAGHPYDWLDQQYAQFHRVSAPGLGERVIYLEWRAGGEAGPISRQRLWVFHADEDGRPAGMDFYTFRAPDPYAGRGGVPGAFETLSPDELVGYPDGCTLTAAPGPGDSVLFAVDAQACRITARSGRSMGIRAEITVAPDTITYAEAGILEGGRYAFLVPGGEELAYEFRPAR